MSEGMNRNAAQSLYGLNQSAENLKNLQQAWKPKDTQKAFDSITKSAKAVDPMAQSMNKSFQGMQSKAGVIQKIVGGIMDGFAVGVEKYKKDFVGALKKGLMEGDIAGMVQGLIDMKYQFVEFSRLNQPFVEVFKPFNQMLSAVAGFATKAVVGSKEFQDFITNLGTEAGMQDLIDLGDKFAKIILKFVEMDWDTAINGIEGLLDGLSNFIDYVKKFEYGAAQAGDLWSTQFSTSPTPGRMSDWLK